MLGTKKSLQNKQDYYVKIGNLCSIFVIIIG